MSLWSAARLWRRGTGPAGGRAVRWYRTVFFGTDDVSLPTLAALHAHPRVTELAVVCAEPRGKVKGVPIVPPVLAFARAHGLPVFHFPDRGDAGWAAWADTVGPAGSWDLGVVVSFGYKLPPPVVGTFAKACVNMHPSALPRHRGAAPIAHTILRGDAATAVSVILLSERMDAGDVVFRSADLPVPPDVTYPALAARLAAEGAAAVAHVVGDLDACLAARQPQTGVPTRAPKVHKPDACVDFERPAAAIDALHRAVGHAFPLVARHLHSQHLVQLLNLRLVPGKRSIAMDATPGAYFVTKEADGPWLNIWCACWRGGVAYAASAVWRPSHRNTCGAPGVAAVTASWWHATRCAGTRRCGFLLVVVGGRPPPAAPGTDLFTPAVVVGAYRAQKS